MSAISSRASPRVVSAVVHRARKVVDVETLLLVGSVPIAARTQVPVRVASREDLDPLLALYGAGPSRLRRWWRRRRLRGYVERGDVCLVIDGGDGLVGAAFLASQPFRLPHYRLPVRVRQGDVYLHGLRVRRDLRGDGYGESLLLAAIEHSAAHGRGRVLAHISPRNPVSPYLFVERLGFEVMGRARVLVLLDRFGSPLPAVPVPRRLRPPVPSLLPRRRRARHGSGQRSG